MGKKAKITLICALAALPLLLIAAFLLFVLPYVNAASSMPEGASLASSSSPRANTASSGPRA